VLIGAAIYALYGMYAPQEESVQERTITVSSGAIEWMVNSWEKRWTRPPTPEELAGMIRQYIRETVLYREALAMGLDEDDIIIRRRLAQKLEFLSQDLLTPADPGRQVLEDWFALNPDKYKAPDLYTMTHIFFDPDKRDAQALEDARATRDELNAIGRVPENVNAYGDPFMLQSYYPDRAESELAKLFGAEFARSVTELEPGRWFGPVLSGYGVHVVYVSTHVSAPAPEFAQVEERVRQDWIDAKREELNERFIEGLLSRYEIIVEETPVPVIGEPVAELRE
jgi:hypothetical protein